jgi:hypothetical protein
MQKKYYSADIYYVFITEKNGVHCQERETPQNIRALNISIPQQKQM